jgi:hypothetical protein
MFKRFLPPATSQPIKSLLLYWGRMNPAITFSVLACDSCNLLGAEAILGYQIFECEKHKAVFDFPKFAVEAILILSLIFKEV